MIELRSRAGPGVRALLEPEKTRDDPGFQASCFFFLLALHSSQIRLDAFQLYALTFSKDGERK